jgi:hypothetical protein
MILTLHRRGLKRKSMLSAKLVSLQKDGQIHKSGAPTYLPEANIVIVR